MKLIDHNESAGLDSLYQRLNEVLAQTPKSAAAIKGQALRAEHYKKLIADAETRRNLRLQESAWVNSNISKLNEEDLPQHSYSALQASKGTPQEAPRLMLHQRVQSGEFAKRGLTGIADYLASTYEIEHPGKMEVYAPAHHSYVKAKHVRYLS